MLGNLFFDVHLQSINQILITMKKLFLLSLLLLSFNVLSYGQEPLSFVKVIRVDSIDKSKIFIDINQWFAKSYNSANDVIQMIDKDAGVLIGKGSFSYSYGRAIYGCWDGYINYTIKVEIKDNRYRIELSNFNHDAGSVCSLGLITTSEVYATTGAQKNYQNNVWNDMKQKIDVFSTNIFNSLENTTNKLLIKEEW